MSQVNEVRKVCLYKSSGDSSAFASACTPYMESEYLRVSEIVEVSFPMLSEDVQTIAEINKIEKDIAQLKEKTIQAIEELEQRKQELLAIGFDGEAHGS